MATTDDEAHELDSLSLREIFNADPRPTFVLDLDPDTTSHANKSDAITPSFCNAAIRSHEALFDAIVGKLARGLVNDDAAKGDGGLDEYRRFKRWANSVTMHDDSKDVYPISFLYGDMLWTGSTVRKRWRVISGNRQWHNEGHMEDLGSAAPHEAVGAVSSNKKSKNSPEPSVVPESVTTLQAQQQPPLAPPESGPNSVVTKTSAAETGRGFRSFFRKGTGSDDTGNSFQSSTITLATSDKAVADWTVDSPRGVLTEHQKFVRSIDWAATPLGPLDSWTPEFRQLANLCLSDPHPAAMFWGPELSVLYNEAYAKTVAGNKHPALMGTGFSGPFAELWDYAGPIFQEAARTGVSARKDNDYLPIDRHGMLEETYFSWTFIPMYGGTNRMLGAFNIPFETTELVISQRRMRTLHRLGITTAESKGVKDFWKLIMKGLEEEDLDVPFAVLYSVADTSEDGEHSSVSTESQISLKTCHFEASLGVPEGHSAASKQLDLKRSAEGFVPAFREAMRTREPTLLRTKDGSLPEALLEGIQWRGFGDACNEAIVFPVRPTNGEAVLAFLVIGVNPRRPYDDEYIAFTSMLNRQLATSLASVILFEEETRRIREVAETAAIEKQQLSEELERQESRLRRMTQLSPLGMFLISPDGVLREANDRFFEMTGLPREAQQEMAWLDFILESSQETIRSGWARLLAGHASWSGELQLKKQRLQQHKKVHGEEIEYWVTFTAQCETSVDGSLLSVLGSIADISDTKWAQGLQARRLEEANEARRQQNMFIDVISHEIRNPLSAILISSDEIRSTIGDCVKGGTTTLSREAIESCFEAADIISLCVQHEKSIVDDVLTISKLDSNLLVMTPVVSQPEVIVRRAIKMFDPELKAKDVKINLELLDSYKDMHVDWVTIDPSRVLQILINLLTNAIKFTANRDKRAITISIGASSKPPDAGDLPGFEYVDPAHESTSMTTGDEWGDGEVLYIGMEVQDTGVGLTTEEKRILFQRFRQASPRTHAQYGGSGLGLFISKRLAELHGGQIGVSSESGVGSKFAFYLECRRAKKPTTEEAASIAAAAPKIERHTSGDTVLRTKATPQRQDFSSTGGTGGILGAHTGTHGGGGQSNSPSLASVADPSPPPAGGDTSLGNGHGDGVKTDGVDPHEVALLVVEDNLINQRVTVRQLRKLGYTVHTANDGVEALAFMERSHLRRPVPEGGGEPLSLVLMDLEMPNMDGLTCVREIRRMEREGQLAGHVPVLAVTANVRDQQLVSARKSGMDDSVSKPFQIKDLLEKIRGLLPRGS
jgi:PAS domain S-box-containing protein